MLENIEYLLESGAHVDDSAEMEDIPSVIKKELQDMEAMNIIDDIMKCMGQGQSKAASEYR